MKMRGSIQLILITLILLSSTEKMEAKSINDHPPVSHGQDTFAPLPDNESYVAHFHIKGNNELIQFIENTNSTGNGLINDPYLVSNITIMLNGSERTGIIIENTTLHTIFKNIEIIRNADTFRDLVIHNCSNISMISDKYWEFEIQQASDISLYNSPHIDGVIKNSSSIYIYSNPNRINLQFERSENIIVKDN